MRAAWVLAACLLAAPAFAGAAPQKAGAKADAKADKAKADPNNVEMPILVAPMIVDGRLTAYAYINPVIEGTSATAVLKIRDQTPFLQDAFIRDLNGPPIVDPKDDTKMDTAGVAARLLADSRRILGAGLVKGVHFSQVQVGVVGPQPVKPPEPVSPPAAAPASDPASAPASAPAGPAAAGAPPQSAVPGH